MSYAIVAAGVVAVGSIAATKMSNDASAEASANATKRAVQQNTYEGTLQEHVKKMEAADQLKASQETANKILEQARYLRAAQMGQTAASGAVVGEGSSQIMMDRTTELAMQDALAALYTGARQSSATEMQGDFAMSRANMQSAGAVAQHQANLDANDARMTGTIISSVASVAGAGVSSYGKSQNPSVSTTTKTT